MQLDVIIVGGGLAGLAAANGLRRAGHRVRIFEKSAFASEIGAGITVTPNGSRVLKRWGFDFERARAVTIRGNLFHDGKTLEFQEFIPWNTGPEPDYFHVYRPDYHAELWRLAVDENGEGPSAQIRLGAEIKRFDAESGTVYLADGSSHTADLVIGADGIHSRIRDAVVPNEIVEEYLGLLAYRFMGSTKDLETDPQMKALFESKKHAWTGFRVGMMEAFFIWYDVRCGDLQNYILLYRSEDMPLSMKGNTQDEITASLLEDSKLLHPLLQKVIKTGYDIKPWKIPLIKPLSTWIKGKALLVGDAAHPTHPVDGQGVNMAVEDAITLQVLLSNIESLDELPSRIRAFEDLRLPRTAIIQLLARTPPGMEHLVPFDIDRYLGDHPPITTRDDRFEFILRYDAFAAAEAVFKDLKSTGSQSRC